MDDIPMDPWGRHWAVGPRLCHSPWSLAAEAYSQHSRRHLEILLVSMVSPEKTWSNLAQGSGLSSVIDLSLVNLSTGAGLATITAKEESLPDNREAD